jgi:hypothetical protein
MALTILVLQFTRSILAGILSSAGELKTSWEDVFDQESH